MAKEPIKYRGVKPVSMVSVLEGNGGDEPFEKIDYVLDYQIVDGLPRMVTLGKLIPLTEEERKFFN